MMNDKEILEKLQEIMRRYVDDTGLLENVRPESSLIDDLQISSAYLIDVMLDIEMYFDIEIDNDDFQRISTVGGAIELVQHKIQPTS